jgi:hypothetical protein
MTFAQLKTSALAATSNVELFKIAKTSNDKLLRNVNKAKLMSYTHGRAVEAGHYFENVIPGWAKINDEIHSLLRAKMSGMSAAEVITVIEEAA